MRQPPRPAPEFSRYSGQIIRREFQEEARKPLIWGHREEALDIGGYGSSSLRIPFGAQRRADPYTNYSETMRPISEWFTWDRVCLRNESHQLQNGFPGMIHPGGPYSAKTALYMAPLLTEGATRDAILRDADTRDRHTSRPGKAREVTNLRM